MIPTAITSEGVVLANFSSPHPFEFTDGTILPACDEERCKRLSMKTIETICESRKGVHLIKLKFELDDEVEKEAMSLQDNSKYDFIICPLPLRQLMDGFDKFVTVRMADRIKKIAYHNIFCQ